MSCVAGFSHSAQCPPGPCRRQQAAGVPSFEGWTTVPCKYRAPCASPPLRRARSGLPSGLWCVVLPRMWVCKPLPESLLPILLVTHPEVEVLATRQFQLKVLGRLHTGFRHRRTVPHPHQSCTGVLISPAGISKQEDAVVGRRHLPWSQSEGH